MKLVIFGSSTGSLSGEQMCFLLLELEERHGVFWKHEACCPFSWELVLVVEFKERKSRLRGGAGSTWGSAKGFFFFSLHLNMGLCERTAFVLGAHSAGKAPGGWGGHTDMLFALALSG